jgi:hypothetical protein
LSGANDSQAGGLRSQAPTAAGALMQALAAGQSLAPNLILTAGVPVASWSNTSSSLGGVSADFDPATGLGPSLVFHHTASGNTLQELDQGVG